MSNTPPIVTSVSGQDPWSRPALADALAALGVRVADTLMVHVSLKAVGPIAGGPATLVAALQDAIGPKGTLLAYGSWDRSPYSETLNGRTLGAADRAAWPAFDPSTAGTYPGFGAFNEFLRQAPGARRSAHPDASMIAVGAEAESLVAVHPFGAAFGRHSPLDRFVARQGRVLLLGAPLDALTVLHYAEAIADVPGKRRVRYEMPILGAQGETVWIATEEFDSNGILDEYAIEGHPDAVERIARDYVTLGRHREGRVGAATCLLLDAADLVRFGVAWLERRHGADAPRP